MPKVRANNLTMNYDQQGTGDPLILIPYLAADCACYAFQVGEYAKHFSCISIDPRGAGESDKPEGVYSMELMADDVAAFMAALGIQKAHVSGLSFGAAVGMWLAAKYPAKVQSLSLHSAWTRTATRFADRLQGAIHGSELWIFEQCAHAPIYERVDEFNQRTLQFLRQHAA